MITEKDELNEQLVVVSELARKALIDEVSTTPKPGLVDRNNNGSHKDMDIFTFINSANSLKPYFYKFAEYGYNTANENERKILPNARIIGMEAEKAMYGATGNINTHKGMVFSGGLICVAVGRLLALGEKVCLDSICDVVRKISCGISDRDFSLKKQPEKMTGGERIYAEYGIKGPRGEAESGFSTIKNHSYPFMKELIENGMNREEVNVRTLLYIMSAAEDTNIIKRGGIISADWVRKRAKSLVYSKMDLIEQFDRELIEKNLSPGGSADMLAITLFILALEEHFDKK